MQRIQLLGLILIITTLLLAVMALGTGTTSIRMRPPEDLWADLMRSDSSTNVGPPADTGAEPERVRFVYVHVAYPLAAVGLLGMLLWSVPGSIAAPFQRRKGRAKRRRR